MRATRSPLRVVPCFVYLNVGAFLQKKRACECTAAPFGLDVQRDTAPAEGRTGPISLVPQQGGSRWGRTARTRRAADSLRGASMASVIEINHCDVGVCEKKHPFGEEDTWKDKRSEHQIGGGEQFMLQDCGAKAHLRRVILFTDTGGIAA